MSAPPPPLAPYYETHVFCCVNERPAGHPRGCCKDKGAEALRDHMKKRVTALGLPGRIRVNQAGCLDRCELGPCLVIYPEGVWYSYATPEDIDEILTVHIRDGGRVDRLMLWPEDRKPEDRLARLGSAERDASGA